MIQREHILQKHLRHWVRDAVSADHVFLSFDSAGKATQNQRARAAARGVAAGTPDTVLHTRGFPPLYAELKAPGGKPPEAQTEMMKRLQIAGCIVEVVRSVHDYFSLLYLVRVPLRINAQVMAQHYDLKIEAEIARAESRVGKSARTTKPAPRYTVGKRVASRAARAGIRL